MYEFNHLKITQIMLWIEVKLDWLTKIHKQERKKTKIGKGEEGFSLEEKAASKRDETR